MFTKNKTNRSKKRSVAQKINFDGNNRTIAVFVCSYDSSIHVALLKGDRDNGGLTATATMGKSVFTLLATKEAIEGVPAEKILREFLKELPEKSDFPDYKVFNRVV